MSDQSQSGAPGGPSAPQTGRWRGRSWLFVTTIALAAGMTGAAASRAVSQHPWHGSRLLWCRIRPDPRGRPCRPCRAASGRRDRRHRRSSRRSCAPSSRPRSRTCCRCAKRWCRRQRGRVLLTQPTVDRAAIEALRAEQMALADEASKRFAQAVGDVAEVLTPEQRRKIDERVTEWRERRGFWHGWRRG